jgi:excisionase family DNA binding protein
VSFTVFSLNSFVAFSSSKALTYVHLKKENIMRTVDRVREVAPPLLNPHDKELVRAAQRCIMASLDHSRAASITVTTDTGETPTVEVPPAALKLIGQLLGAMSEGRAVMLVPADQEFTTVEAANFLNVSRPFVIKEIESGRLPHRKVGSHRRIAFEDLMAYARKMREQQASALERMADNAREMGLDY